MAAPTLEERVTRLEKTLAHLLTQAEKTGAAKDWHSTLGMFDDDALMHDIDEAGRHIREADRWQAQA